jgi:hypothetical protein
MTVTWPLRAALGEEAFGTAWAAGWAMTVEQAIDLALEACPGFQTLEASLPLPNGRDEPK